MARNSIFKDLPPKDNNVGAFAKLANESAAKEVQENSSEPNHAPAEAASENASVEEVPASPKPARKRQARGSADKPVKKAKEKVTFYLPQEDLDYVDLVWRSTQVQTGIRFKTAFFEEAINFYLNHLEEEHNNGKRYKNPFAKK